MFCPNCGTQNADGSHFCQNCGMTLTPVSGGGTAGQIAPAPSGLSSWRTVGWIDLAGAALSLLGFFLPWITMGSNLFGGLLVSPGSQAFAGGSVSGWSLFFLIINVAPTLFENRYGFSPISGLGALPFTTQLLIILAIIDLVALILVPIMSIVSVVHGYRMVENSSANAAVQSARQHRMRRSAILGLIPTIGLFLLIQGLLGFSLSGQFGNFGGGASLGLNLMGAGFWLTVIGLGVIIFAGPLAAPKNR